MLRDVMARPTCSRSAGAWWRADFTLVVQAQPPIGIADRLAAEPCRFWRRFEALPGVVGPQQGILAERGRQHDRVDLVAAHELIERRSEIARAEPLRRHVHLEHARIVEEIELRRV